jgi:hypothetical protein
MMYNLWAPLHILDNTKHPIKQTTKQIFFNKIVNINLQKSVTNNMYFFFYSEASILLGTHKTSKNDTIKDSHKI